MIGRSFLRPTLKREWLIPVLRLFLGAIFIASGVAKLPHRADFIDIVKTLWQNNFGCQTEDEFCEMNGIPKTFFEKVIKK